MNGQGQIPRSRGGICGALLVLLGLWGGLAPFVGPYFHFGFAPDKAWAYNSGRLYYSVIPGAAALLGGLVVTATRNRGVGVAGGLLASLSGAWFIVGPGILIDVLNRPIDIGAPILTASASATASASSLRAYLESVALLGGVGIVILAVAGIAMGRFSMVAARDAASAASYYPDYSVPSSASQPDLSQYPTTFAKFPSGTTGPLPAVTDQPATSEPPFAPAPFPDTITATQLAPPESPS
jgi:hypothetical protein